LMATNTTTYQWVGLWKTGRKRLFRTGMGMDTFIWRSKRPFDRPLAAWKNYPLQPPYSREEWLAVFPSGARRLLGPSELLTV